MAAIDKAKRDHNKGEKAASRLRARQEHQVARPILRSQEPARRVASQGKPAEQSPAGPKLDPRTGGFLLLPLAPYHFFMSRVLGYDTPLVPEAAACPPVVEQVVPLKPSQSLDPVRSNAVPMSFKAKLVSGGVPFFAGFGASLAFRKSLIFSLAAHFMTAQATPADQLVATIVSSMIIGAGFGAVPYLLKITVGNQINKRIFHQEIAQKDKFRTRTLLTRMGFGALGGLSGGLLTHWGEATDFVSSFAPKTGAAMHVVGEGAKVGWHYITENCARLWSAAKEGAAASMQAFRDSVPQVKNLLSTQFESLRDFFSHPSNGLKGLAFNEATLPARPKIPSAIETLSRLKETVATPPFSAPAGHEIRLPVGGSPLILTQYGLPDEGTLLLKKTAEVAASFDKLSEATQAAQAAQNAAEHIAPGFEKLVAATKAATAQAAVESLPPIHLPRVFRGLISEDCFHHLSREMQEKAAQLGKMGSRLPVRAALCFFANAGHELYNCPGATLLDKKAAAALWRQVAQIASDKGWIDDPNAPHAGLIKTSLANLAECCRFGVTADGKPNIALAAYYAIKGAGTHYTDKVLSRITAIAPQAVKTALSQLPALQRYRQLTCG